MSSNKQDTETTDKDPEGKRDGSGSVWSGIADFLGSILAIFS